MQPTTFKDEDPQAHGTSATAWQTASGRPTGIPAPQVHTEEQLLLRAAAVAVAIATAVDLLPINAAYIEPLK
jgi:hypothetical protein